MGLVAVWRATSCASSTGACRPTGRASAAPDLARRRDPLATALRKRQPVWLETRENQALPVAFDRISAENNANVFSLPLLMATS
jgi:hypothetical protein